MPNKTPCTKPMLAAGLYGLLPNPELSFAEGVTLEYAREWRRAETDPALFAELSAWYGMQFYVRSYCKGEFNMQEAASTIGTDRAAEFYSAVKTVAELLHVFDDDLEPTEANAPAEIASVAIGEGGTTDAS